MHQVFAQHWKNKKIDASSGEVSEGIVGATLFIEEILKSPPKQAFIERWANSNSSTYKYSPLPGFEPGTRNGSQYEVDDIPMCHGASVTNV